MKKFWYLVIACLAFLPIAQGHVVPYEVAQLGHATVFVQYLAIGYQHIIPDGFDHILFITCVFLMNTRLKDIVIQASMFTLAHSITLAMAMYGVIHPPAAIVEPLIALSILVLALENIFLSGHRKWRMATVFLFGLVHGMGFANALSGLGLPSNAFATALVAFNIGVELGQLSIILLLFFASSKPFALKPWYQSVVVKPASIAIALIACYWVVTRIWQP